jgi:hypothetical protein
LKIQHVDEEKHMGKWAGNLAIIAVCLACVLCLISSCKDQDVNPQLIPRQFQALTVYDTDRFTGTSPDSTALAEIPHVTLQKDILKKIFENVTYHQESKVLWKGTWLGIARMPDGTERRIVMSYRDGAFMILDHRGYYEVVGQSRQAFDAQMKAILSDRFIPARQKLMEARDGGAQ